MTPLRVLITNITLASRTGTEINVRDIAVGLLRRGHAPVVYSPDAGEMAAEIRSATVPVVTDLAQLGIAPDVIHGHHHPETMQALLRFPGVPAIFFSHDFLAWHDAAPDFPRILRYVAVDDTNRDRLVCEQGIPPDRVHVVLNTVDLERFRPRPPLPARPGRALVFSNYARDDTHLSAVREASRRAGLALDVIGDGVGASTERPETLLGSYDLVFAKGRCALEALAVGAAVVLCDYAGAGPLVTSGDLDRLRRLNFGRRLLQHPATPERLEAEIARYDAADAAEVSRRVRRTAGVEASLDTLEALYCEVVAEQAQRVPDPVAELAAAAVYLRRWGPRFKDGPLRTEIERLGAEADVLRRERDVARARTDAAERAGEALRVDIARLALELDAVRAREVARGQDLSRLEGERTRLQREYARLEREHAWAIGSATWRLRERLLRIRALVSVYRAARGLGSLVGTLAKAGSR